MIDVRAGRYTVTETRAPVGDVPSAPVSVQVVPKAGASATFVNVPGVAAIEISLSDATTKAPLKGGVFQVTSGGAPFATCTTVDAGLYPLSYPGAKVPNEVPLGQYTVQQMTAPSGYQPVTDPVSVSLDLP